MFITYMNNEGINEAVDVAGDSPASRSIDSVVDDFVACVAENTTGDTCKLASKNITKDTDGSEYADIQLLIEFDVGEIDDIEDFNLGDKYYAGHGVYRSHGYLSDHYLDGEIEQLKAWFAGDVTISDDDGVEYPIHSEFTDSDVDNTVEIVTEEEPQTYDYPGSFDWELDGELKLTLDFRIKLAPTL